MKYSRTQSEVGQIMKNLHCKTFDRKNRRFSKDPSRSRMANKSPFDMSLIERSSEFGYDDYGSRTIDEVGLPHSCSNRSKARDAADFVARKFAFYQRCRNSEVHYSPVSLKQAIIFATVPSKLELRAGYNKDNRSVSRSKLSSALLSQSNDRLQTGLNEEDNSRMSSKPALTLKSG